MSFKNIVCRNTSIQIERYNSTHLIIFLKCNNNRTCCTLMTMHNPAEIFLLYGGEVLRNRWVIHDLLFLWIHTEIENRSALGSLIVIIHFKSCTINNWSNQLQWTCNHPFNFTFHFMTWWIISKPYIIRNSLIHHVYTLLFKLAIDLKYLSYYTSKTYSL